MNDLAILKHAQQALDKAHSIREVKDVRDQAEVVRAYMRRQGYGLDYQNKGAEIKILAECRLGELLTEMPKHPAGRPGVNRSHDVTDFPPTLAEQGITKNDSSRWQRMAGVPVVERDAKIEELKAKKKELTSAAILAMAKQNDFDALAVEGNIEKGPLSTVIR